MGRDFCKALLTYHYTIERDNGFMIKNELLLSTTNIKNGSQVKKSMSTSTFYKSVPYFDKKSLINELNNELDQQLKLNKVSKNENDLLNQNLQEVNDSDGSDSEPSADNLDNEELIKLLPTQSKKKSIYIIY